MELSLSRSKSESCISEVTLEPLNIETHSISSESLSAKIDHELWFNFDKLQSLADQLEITTEKAFIQYQLKYLATTSSSVSPPSTSVTSPKASVSSSFIPPPFVPYFHVQPIAVTLLPLLVSSSLPTQPIVVPPPPPAVMAQFAPLILPAQLSALPQNYGQRLPLFYGSAEITAQHHVDKLIDFIDLEEIDDDDAKMRIIAQRFLGDVKKWFRSLDVNSINKSQRLIELFLARWQEKKNPLQVLA